MTVRLPLAEPVRTGTDVVLDVDRRLAGGGSHGGGIDRGAAVDERHQVLPGAERVLEDQLDAVVAGRRDFGDVRKKQLPARTVFAPTLQRSHDIGGGHGLAVMELHSLAQMDGNGLAVAADLLAGSEQWPRLVVCVERVQPLEDVMGDGGCEIGCHHLLVEAWRLTNGSVVQRASREGGRRDGRAERQQGDPGGDSRRCSNDIHDGSSSHWVTGWSADADRAWDCKNNFHILQFKPQNCPNYEKYFLFPPPRSLCAASHRSGIR